MSRKEKILPIPICMWVYASIKGCEQPVRYFDYRPGRSGKYPQEFLKGFHGYIHTDAYKGYKKVEGITRCFCRTHLRRYFVDALPKDVKSSDATIPAKAIEYINQLFSMEKRLEIFSLEGRKKQRLEEE